MIVRLYCTLAVAVFVSGCVSNDPRQGGFVNGLVNAATGGYQARIDARERELAQLQGDQARLTARLSSQRSEVRTLKARIAVTNQRIAIWRARAQAGEDLATVRAQIQRLERIREEQVRELERSIDRTSRSGDRSPTFTPLQPGRV
jgi:septal ring factor EnvC (AmiA/AmiB activator)